MNYHSWIATAAAAEAAPATAVTGTAPKTADKSSGPSPFLLIGLMIFLMWFIVFRPQKKERQQRQKLLDAVKKGDRVITIGGLHGKVADVDATHNIVTVEIAPKISVKFNRSAIATVDAKDSGKAPSEEEGEKK